MAHTHSPEMFTRNAFFVSLLLCCSWLHSITASVTYDNKAVVINGKRRILISGSIHYPRSTPEMWPSLIQMAKDGGLDVIQTYVFWNGHEPSPGNYYFEDNYDLVKFIKLVQQAGLYVHLRIGPYVCAEWNFGGLPVWLKYVPGMSFRTSNGPFQDAMQKFTTKIVTMMKAERLFQTQGGPIILSQIENEYGPVEWEIGQPGKDYTQWAAKMAVGLGTGVPWVMCKQEDVPDPLIDTCNGFYCENFEPKKSYRPKIWTEAWTGWLTEFGGAVPHRPAEDLAFAVARFIQNRGSFINYYMYHGGTNFGRTAGGPFIATSYDYDAPIDEYGLPNQPKWGHLRDLHKAIKLCEPALVSVDPQVIYFGVNLEAHVFQAQGSCAAFLANDNPSKSATVTFRNFPYTLPAWSVSILPDCKTVTFNTAQVYQKKAYPKMAYVESFHWSSYVETVPFANDHDTFSKNGLVEQLSLTWDKTDYLWYMTEFTVNANEECLRTGKWPHLTLWSAGHTLHVFINGQLVGTVYGNMENPKVSFSQNVKISAGVNKLSLLSAAVGLPNVGVHYEKWNTGVMGPVWLSGMNSGTWDLSKWKWSYKVGLRGEDMNLHTARGESSVRWSGEQWLAKHRPLTWYKASFDAPAGNNPVALDMNTMGKGLVYVNGRSIGRHWAQYKAKGQCGACNYAGLYNENKCRTDCGEASQRWYHVPRSWLYPKGNLLVVFEESGGDPTGISLVQRTLQYY